MQPHMSKRNTIKILKLSALSYPTIKMIPISSIDGCAIGKPGKTGPKPGPITKAIQERHAKMLAGKLDEYAAWLVKVE